MLFYLIAIDKGEANITGGEFNGTFSTAVSTCAFNITGGTFSSDPRGFDNVTILEDYDAVKTGENEWTVRSTVLAGKGTEAEPYLINSADDLHANQFLKII